MWWFHDEKLVVFPSQSSPMPILWTQSERLLALSVAQIKNIDPDRMALPVPHVNRIPHAGEGVKIVQNDGQSERTISDGLDHHSDLCGAAP